MSEAGLSSGAGRHTPPEISKSRARRAPPRIGIRNPQAGKTEAGEGEREPGFNLTAAAAAHLTTNAKSSETLLDRDTRPNYATCREQG